MWKEVEESDPEPSDEAFNCFAGSSPRAPGEMFLLPEEEKDIICLRRIRSSKTQLRRLWIAYYVVSLRNWKWEKIHEIHLHITLSNEKIQETCECPQTFFLNSSREISYLYS
ncbi:hypothetical protein SLA2020_350190 [Shorea laevis]